MRGAFLMAVGAIVLTAAAQAQDVIDLHRHAQYGGPGYNYSSPPDPYDGIKNFDGLSCCGGYDCRKATNSRDFTPIANGYLIKPTGENVPMGWTGFSPDAGWHVCRFTSDGGGEKGRRKWKKGDVRCLLVPPGGA